MRTFINITCLLLLLSSQVVSAQRVPDAGQRDAWVAFDEVQGNDWQVRWNPHTGTPSHLLGITSTSKGARPEVAARQFMYDLRAAFGLPDDLSTLRLMNVQQEQESGRNHVRFQQTVNGIPVEGAEYLVHLLPDGRVFMANGTYHPDVSVEHTPRLSAQQATSVAYVALAPLPVPDETKTELVILPNEESFRLSWKVTVWHRRPAYDRTYYVDAFTGEVLDERNNLRDDNGTGKAYPENPFHTSSETTVTLTNLDGSGYLQGTYAHVETEDLTISNYANLPVYNASLEFLYDPDDINGDEYRFNEANVYYHLNEFRNWFNNNVASPYVGQVFVDTNDPTAPGSANYNPGAHRITLGLQNDNQLVYNYLTQSYVSKTVYDLNRANQTISHEYTHAIISSVSSLGTGYSEAGAIDEGVADYYTAAWSGRTLKGQYAYQEFSARSTYPGWQRSVTNPQINDYNDYTNTQHPLWFRGRDFQDPHMGGEFFSSILWDVRGVLSSSYADDLVLSTLQLLSSDATFGDFLLGMLQVDYVETSGSYINTIEYQFNQKGVYAPLFANITGPTTLSYNQQGTWSADALGGEGTPSYTWYKKEPATSSTWVQVDTGLSYDYTMGDDSFRLKLVISAGSETAEDEIYVQKTSCQWCKNEEDAPAMTEETLPPARFELLPNYPNPFNPSTQIRFALPEAADVSLVVYDMMGREVTQLIDGPVEAGYHEVSWEATNLPSGVYMYQLASGGYVETQRMILTK